MRQAKSKKFENTNVNTGILKIRGVKFMKKNEKQFDDHRQIRGGRDCRRKTKIKILKPAVLTASIAMMLCSIAAATAFWTDMITINEEVSALDIGIKYDATGIGLTGAEPYTPGDSRDFTFTVVNSGDISVDIKPEMTITSSADMVYGKTGFVITDASGTEVTDYTIRYYGEDDQEITKSEAEDGTAYRKAVYTFTGEETLSGGAQADTSLGENADSKKYDYKLKLLSTTVNDYIGASASLDVSTYAIQHRNREENADWISIVEKQ